MVSPRQITIKISPKYFCFSVTVNATPLIDIGGYEIPAERFNTLNHMTEGFLKLIFILLCRTQCCINESCEHIIEQQLS